MYSPFVQNFEKAVNAITERFSDLQKRHSLLRKQYGIASKKIHLLKAENALLRERLNTKLVSEPRVFNAGDPEPQNKSITLKSFSPLEYENSAFTLKYVQNSWDDRYNWWSFVDDKQHSWASWNHWVNNYGPFEVVDV